MVEETTAQVNLESGLGCSSSSRSTNPAGPVKRISKSGPRWSPPSKPQAAGENGELLIPASYLSNKGGIASAVEEWGLNAEAAPQHGWENIAFLVDSVIQSLFEKIVSPEVYILRYLENPKTHLYPTRQAALWNLMSGYLDQCQVQ